mmetsp:Transcript_28328/g.76313  ORF Transcript_28328/g.76313 Transcript_28328/m.76313 type:complete len:230 (-) Transcript_28328:229-918(-)
MIQAVRARRCRDCRSLSVRGMHCASCRFTVCASCAETAQPVAGGAKERYCQLCWTNRAATMAAEDLRHVFLRADHVQHQHRLASEYRDANTLILNAEGFNPQRGTDGRMAARPSMDASFLITAAEQPTLRRAVSPPKTPIAGALITDAGGVASWRRPRFRSWRRSAAGSTDTSPRNSVSGATPPQGKTAGRGSAEGASPWAQQGHKSTGVQRSPRIDHAHALNIVSPIR